MEKKTILILAANPKDTTRIRLEQEVRDIENGLERSKHRDQYIIRSILAARVTDVRRAMLDTRPTIVHFCGHGTGEPGIVFEDDYGKAQLVGTVALANFFRLFADSVKCVVLNACYSDEQARAIAEHIPRVVGMSQSVDDSDALKFAVAFYDAVGAGYNFDFAFETARNALEWTGTPTGPTVPTLQKAAGHKTAVMIASPVSEVAADVSNGYEDKDIGDTRALPKGRPPDELTGEVQTGRRLPLARLLLILVLPLAILAALLITYPIAEKQVEAHALVRAVGVEGLARFIGVFDMSDVNYNTARSIASGFVPPDTICTPLAQDFACEIVGFQATFAQLKQCIVDTTNADGSAKTGSEGRVTCNAYLRPPLAALKSAAIAIEKDRSPSNLWVVIDCIVLKVMSCGPTSAETSAVNQFKALYAFPPTGDLTEILAKDPNDMSL